MFCFFLVTGMVESADQSSSERSLKLNSLVLGMVIGVEVIAYSAERFGVMCAGE